MLIAIFFMNAPASNIIQFPDFLAVKYVCLVQSIKMTHPDWRFWGLCGQKIDLNIDSSECVKALKKCRV